MYKKHSLVFILSGFIFFILTFGICYYFFMFHPLYTSAGYWVAEVYAVKDLRAQAITNNKIIIMSGSNALFGINSGLLEAKLNKPVLNLAVYANLPFWFLEKKIKQYSQAGDIVVLPIEYPVYSKQGIDEGMINDFTTWGTSELLSQSYPLQLQYILAAIPKYSLRLKDYNKDIPVRNFDDIKQMMDDKNFVLTKKNLYTADGVNKYGEFLCDFPATKHVRSLAQKGNGYGIATAISQDCHEFIGRVVAYAKKNDITILFSYPPSFKNQYFNLDESKHYAKFETFMSAIKDAGAVFIGDPKMYNFDVELFYDTNFHLNAEGAIFRSLLLADDVQEYLNKENEFIRDAHYVSTRRVEAKEYLEHLRNQSRKLKVSERIFFTTSGSGSVFLNSGWSGAESWGTWSNGKHAEIIFSMQEPVNKIVIEGSSAFFQQNTQQHIMISLNGRTVYDVRHKLGSDNGIIIALTEEMRTEIASVGYVKLEFEFPDALSPSALGLSGDTRQLAFGIRSMFVE